MVAMFGVEDIKTLLENLSMCFTFAMVSVKMFIIWSNMEGLNRCKDICYEMDAKARKNKKEFKILFELKEKVKVLMAPYLFLFTSACFTSILGLFFNTERRLLFPAYFPFDWKSNDMLYGFTILYQSLGLIGQAYTDCCNDTYIPLSMCLMTYHLRVLSERISKIGTTKEKGLSDNHKDLQIAIKDHKKILE